MQHIPVVSHGLWRGTFILKMLDVVPTIQTPGSYHRQDSCLFTVGKSLTGLGSRGGEVSGGEVEVSHWCQWRREISKGLWVASPHQQGQPCLALLTSTAVSAFEWVWGGGQVNSGSSVHSAGRAKVVSHPLIDTMVPPQSVYLSPHHFHSPLTQPASSLFFFHAVVSGQEPDRRMDGNVKTSYLIQTVPLCYRIIISQRKDMILCHIKTFLQHFRIVKENTPSRP